MLSKLISGDRKREFECEAVDLAYEAVFSDFYRINPRYLNSELNHNRRNSYNEMIKDVCRSTIEHFPNSQLEWRANKILDKLMSM